MTTSPNPLAGLFGGAQQQQSLPLQPGAGPVVPGGTPAPDPTAAAQQALGMSKEQMALLNQALQQAATPRFGGGQQPAVPGQQQPMSPTPPSYMTDRPYASTWGPERFMYGVQSAISHLSAAKQERDVRKAENLYTNTLTAAQKYMKPDGTFDANAAAQDPFLSTLKDSDYKKMADTLQESWLNPKSTSAHKEGLTAAKQKFDAQQQQRGRLDKFVQGLIHKATQPLRGGPQLTPEQQQSQTTNILKRAPLGPAGGNVQDALAMAKSQLELAQAQKALQQKYVSANDWSTGKVVVYDPANPHDSFTLTNGSTGKDVGAKPAAKQGQLALGPGGIPYGVNWNGRVVPPNDPEAQSIPNYAQLMQAGNDAYLEKDFLKIPPDIRGQLPPPPNPNDTAKYPGGRGDPKYFADLKPYMKSVDDLEEAKASAAGVARAAAFSTLRPMAAVDPNDPSKIVALPAGQVIARGLALPQSTEPQVVRKITEYMTTGPGGQQLTAFRTALDHADLLGDALDAMQNKDIPALNLIRNKWKTEMGGPEVTNFDVIANAYVREINKMLSAGHVTDAEIASAGATLPDKASPDQIRGALDAYRSLATSKAMELQKQYEQARQGKPAFPPSVTGRPAATPQGAAGGAPAASRQTAGRAAPPAATMPPGTSGKARGSDGNWYYHDSKGKILGQAPAQ